MPEQTGFEGLEPQEEPDKFEEVTTHPDSVMEGGEPEGIVGGDVPRSTGASQADYIPGTPAPDPLQTPQSNADLEAARVNMNRHFTQQSQSFAQEKREWQAQRDADQKRMDERHQSLLDLHKANQPPEQSPDLMRHLPPALREGMSQDARVLMESVGAIVKGEVDGIRDQFASQQQQQQQPSPELIERLDRVEQQTQAAQQAQRTQTWRAEAQHLQNEMGAEAFNPHAPNVGQLLTQNPNLSVLQAFYMVAPQAYDQYLMNKGRTEAASNKQQANAAHLQGAGAAHPNAQPQPGYRRGESMEESANAVSGGAF